MSIIITPLSPERLGVTGNMKTELRIPFDADEDRFHLAVSDGTLLVGHYEPEDDRFHFQVEIEGAGIVRIAGETVTLDWQAEWVTIAVYQPVATAVRDIAPPPLFEIAWPAIPSTSQPGMEATGHNDSSWPSGALR